MIEEEEGDKKRKTKFDPEQEIVIWSMKGSQTGLKTMCKKAQDNTGGRFNKNKVTAEGVAEGREPVEVVSKTGDPVCKTSDKKGGETAGERRNQTDSVGKTESEVNTETDFKASCEGKKKSEKTGWLLVCGQGFQLLRVRNTEMDAEMWTTRRERKKGESQS